MRESEKEVYDVKRPRKVWLDHVSLLLVFLYRIRDFWEVSNLIWFFYLLPIYCVGIFINLDSDLIPYPSEWWLWIIYQLPYFILVNNCTSKIRVSHPPGPPPCSSPPGTASHDEGVLLPEPQTYFYDARKIVTSVNILDINIISYMSICRLQ